jgi:hypothetical protein
MNSIVFDTHAAANRFKRAGFTEDQVEALVEVTRDTTALPDISTLATRADIERLEGSTKAQFERLESSTKADIEHLRTDFGRLETSTKAQIERLETSTKAQIERLESSTKVDAEQRTLLLRSELKELETRMDARFAKMEARIVSSQVQTLAIMIPAVGIIVAVAKLFH